MKYQGEYFGRSNRPYEEIRWATLNRFSQRSQGFPDLEGSFFFLKNLNHIRGTTYFFGFQLIDGFGPENSRQTGEAVQVTMVIGGAEKKKQFGFLPTFRSKRDR